MFSIGASKDALREDIALKISGLTADEKRRQSKVVYEKLVNLPVFKSSKRVSIYLSIPNEIDTEPIVRKLFELEKTCFVPRSNKAGMQMVRLNSMEDWANLSTTKWDIKQPSLKEEREDALNTGGLELIICPGVAFTVSGDRLGHGTGHYDAYLRRLGNIQEKPATTVAVSFREQIVGSLPMTSRDVTVDLVLYAE